MDAWTMVAILYVGGGLGAFVAWCISIVKQLNARIDELEKENELYKKEIDHITQNIRETERRRNYNIDER